MRTLLCFFLLLNARDRSAFAEEAPIFPEIEAEVLILQHRLEQILTVNGWRGSPRPGPAWTPIRSRMDQKKDATTERCGDDPATPCYFAYVSHLFENYISVYDLESIDEAVRAGRSEPGHFLIEGKKGALTLSCKECIEGIHIGDIPLALTKGQPPKRAFLHNRQLGIDLAVQTETGGQGLLIKPLLPPWGPAQKNSLSVAGSGPKLLTCLYHLYAVYRI